MADIKVTRSFTVHLVLALSPRGEEWLDQNLGESHSVVVEHRFAEEIVLGMLEDALTVEVDGKRAVAQEQTVYLVAANWDDIQFNRERGRSTSEPSDAKGSQSKSEEVAKSLVPPRLRLGPQVLEAGLDGKLLPLAHGASDLLIVPAPLDQVLVVPQRGDAGGGLLAEDLKRNFLSNDLVSFHEKMLAPGLLLGQDLPREITPSSASSSSSACALTPPRTRHDGTPGQHPLPMG